MSKGEPPLLHFDSGNGPICGFKYDSKWNEKMQDYESTFPKEYLDDSLTHLRQKCPDCLRVYRENQTKE